MKSGLKALWDIVKGFIVLILLVALGIAALQYLGGLIVKGIEALSEIVSKTDAVVIVALITGGISIFGVVISSIVAKVLDYRQKTKRYLYEKREEPYSDFIDMVYKIMHSAKLGKEYPETEMLEDTVRFSRKLTLWGSSRVIKKWLKFRLASQNDNFNPKENIFVMEDIIFEIRKDMGQKKNGLKKGDLLSFFVNDISNYLAASNNSTSSRN